MDDMDTNRRKYPRYDTEMEVYFKVRYDTSIRIEFRVIENRKEGNADSKYFGLCNNVSAEGLLIVSKKSLAKDDILMLEVYDPIMKNPIKMEGQVRWSEKCPGSSREHDMAYAGVQIVSVNDKPVVDSLYFDKKYMVVWSAVLEAVFGTFAAIRNATKKR
ncbi:MAG: PilZ domain-containing protein [Candidatus Omnitrophota bacterium]